MLRTYARGGQGRAFEPARETVPAAGDLEEEALWAAMPATVRDAVAASPADWYDHYANWQTGPRGRYFLNYYYGTPSYMGPLAEAVVRATRPYTAMSHFELFADADARFFRDPAGYTDPAKWGGGLPSAVQDWFRAHVLERQPYTPPGTESASLASTPATVGTAASPNAVQG